MGNLGMAGFKTSSSWPWCPLAGASELLESAKDDEWHDKMKKISKFFVEPHGEPFSRRLRQLCEKIMAAS